jgi:hypothetical protein
MLLPPLIVNTPSAIARRCARPSRAGALLRHNDRRGHGLRRVRRSLGEGGFALLVTIVLVAFLVLILVGLASFTRVETQVASNSQQVAQARQNALMALNIALGQLQKHTGPDQRVTARADIILPAGVTITPPTFNFDNFDVGPLGTGGKFTDPGSTGAEVLAAVDDYWANPATPRNRHWTGAWRNTNTSVYDRNNPAAFNPAPGRFINDDPAQRELAPVWLVSGGESAVAFSPGSAVTGLALTTTAIDDSLRDSANNATHRLLVGSATTGAVAPGDLERYVTAPQIPIRGTVSGLEGEQDIGHYAWWVGDEGVKARADLIDPYGPVAGTVPASPDAARNLKRRQSAQRPVIEAMTTTGSDGLAPFFADLAGDANLRNIVAVSQFPYLESAPAFRPELDSRYHDLSVSSRGVLADTKNGGLKRDLTHILSRPSIATFRNALNTPDYNVAPSGSYNIALTPAATPYATIPDNEPTGAAYNLGQGIFAGSATWEQLWSFYNVRESTPLGVFTSGGIAASRPSSGIQQPLYPLLVQGKLFYSMVVNGGAVTLRVTPIVVLANPYNVPLSGEFILSFPNPSIAVATGKIEDPSAEIVYSGETDPNYRGGPDHPTNPSLLPGENGYTNNVFIRAGNALPNAGLANITLLVKAEEIPAGVAQIFSVDPSADLTISGPNDAHEVPMINTYDPSVYLTYATGRSIDTSKGHTHAAIYGTGITGQLHMGTKTTVNRVAYVSTKSPPESTGVPVEFGFLVYPLESGYHRGGGVFFTLQDGKKAHQQALFYQLNYRSLVTNTVGSTGLGDHPLQWGTSYGIRGLNGDTDIGPHSLLSANILAPLDEAIPETTRWGLVASGEYPSLNTPPPEVDMDVGFVNRLYDLPTPDAAITSLGQLQHFNLTGHLSNPDASINANGFLVNYPIGNSYPGPRVRRHRVFFSSAPFGYHHDASYIWNDLLWDRFTFSSYPADGEFAFSNTQDGYLINSRYRPFRSASAVPFDIETHFRGVFEPARNLLVEGAFNINSTSVEAWKATFSALKNVPIGTENSPSAPFSRTLSPVGGSTDARTGVSTNSWSGFNDLTPAEIHELAEEMVLQVRLRGPFLSLSDFVNRRLTLGPTVRANGLDRPDPYRLGLSGALQTAIDRTINHKAVVPGDYRLTSTRNETTSSVDNSTKGTHLQGHYLADLEYRMPTRIAGYPGYLLQADVLSALAPNLAARSDTFTIRTYGDVRSPSTDTITARAWCEAVVQRIPDYIDPDATAAEATPAPGTPNATFGRRYQVVSFRWLTPADI